MLENPFMKNLSEINKIWTLKKNYFKHKNLIRKNKLYIYDFFFYNEKNLFRIKSILSLISEMRTSNNRTH